MIKVTFVHKNESEEHNEWAPTLTAWEVNQLALERCPHVCIQQNVTAKNTQ